MPRRKKPRRRSEGGRRFRTSISAILNLFQDNGPQLVVLKQVQDDDAMVVPFLRFLERRQRRKRPRLPLAQHAAFLEDAVGIGVARKGVERERERLHRRSPTSTPPGSSGMVSKSSSPNSISASASPGTSNAAT